MPHTYTHLSSWGLSHRESDCRMKMRIQEEIELKTMMEWCGRKKEAWENSPFELHM